MPHLARAALLGSLLAAAGCASAASAPPPRAADDAIATWVAREARPSPPIRFANPDALRLTDERSADEHTIGGHAWDSSRESLGETAPRATGPAVDVSLHGAPLGSALRLLAEAADLGIVLGEGLTAPVDVELRRVRPMDAMFALAQAHQVELTVRGRTVIARLP